MNVEPDYQDDSEKRTAQACHVEWSETSRGDAPSSVGTAIRLTVIFRYAQDDKKIDLSLLDSQDVEILFDAPRPFAQHQQS